MKKSFILLSFLVLNVFAGSINIAVAANVSYAIEELKAEFGKIYPDIKVNVTLGSSGKLTAQIIHGAPYGLFMSANMLYPKRLYKKKIATTQPRVYAKGSLALFSVKEYDFSKGLALLEQKDVKRIAIGNPKTAPYGKAAFEALKNAHILTKVQSKFIYGESISQTISYTVTAADIGIVAKSSLYSSKMARYKEGEHWSVIDPKLYTPIKQGIVLLKNANNTQEYQAFYDFIVSKRAQAVFQKYGYIVS